MSTLLILKLTVTPILVALMSLAARKFGPAMGGIILGLPWMTGPILYFLALENGEEYLAEAARGVLLAVPAIGTYAVAYVLVARRAGWLPSLSAGALTFGVTGVALSQLTASATFIALGAVATLLAVRAFIPQPRRTILGLTLPWWDIPARMTATAALIACMTVIADYVGPTLVGIVSSFPVIMTVVTTFTHYRWGVEPAMALLRGIMLSLVGFVWFFWIVALLAGRLPPEPVFAIATACGIVFSSSLLVISHRRAKA